MKNCPNCNFQADDNAIFCGNCGTKLNVENTTSSYEQTPPIPPQPQVSYAPPFDPFDHTAEFEPKDISDNKVIAMLVYLMGTIGILIALLAAGSSKYVSFHIRQALKITVVTLLAGICAVLLCWTIVVPLAFFVLLIALFVIKIICFFQVCSGKAVEPSIIRDLKFLK